ncbi:unnamed protein product [Cuscuta epithymum]|uniref:OTU domain-containing protein n=2 Tax=Cuscuta epithymum TaxID=186058 RepID=A0AAV0D7Q4_9ASTE|nr:unnamed protein product [Cuscuta epithymum]
MEDIPRVEDELSDLTSENDSQKKQETLEEMLSRHRNEISRLQDKETAMKKVAAKGSKAEQRAKKKQVDEEISKLSAELKDMHNRELASLGFNNGNNTNDQDSKGDLNNLVNAIAGISVHMAHSDHSKPSKSVKKREKRAQQEAAREQRIQEEQSNIQSDRAIEDEKLVKKLGPLGLTVNQIKPDGHCLYRAVEDQLSIQSRGACPYTYLELRQMAAGYMRKHSSYFLPFFLSEKVGGSLGHDDSVLKRFEDYCGEVESTAVWGGQLELGALTHVLKKHVVIYSGSFPDVEMGKEYYNNDEPNGGTSSFGPDSILLSYHRHAYGLGEHYNSVVPKLP